VVRGHAQARAGVFIGTLVLRHSPHHALLMRSGWKEIPATDIGIGVEKTAGDANLGC
jgi:hypothetical protein